MSVMADDSNSLDILGQIPGLKIYTQISLCYTLPESKSEIEVADILKAGLARLASRFPWVAARVHSEEANQGNSGVWKFKPLEKTPRLVVRDLRKDAKIPSMDQMTEANFPIRMLDESVTAPIATLPSLAPESETGKDSPVFALQATFIKGGLLLTFVAEHRTMDGVGQGQVLYLLSKACRGENFTSDELSTGNLDRKDRIPLLDSSYKPGSELEHQIIKAPATSDTSSSSTNSGPPPTCTWANFGFSLESQKGLKALASESLTLPVGAFVSTDDALTAFIWQSVMRSRLDRLPSATEIIFARAVDVRSFLKVPQTYTGMMQTMTYHTMSLEDIVARPLGAIASNLRHAIDPKTSSLVYDTRALATHMDRTLNKSIFSLTASLVLPRDLMLSSWVKLNCYDLDFGLGLGKPLAVRRPRFAPVESLGYLLPRSPSGDVVLAICLRDEDLASLRRDNEWNKYATYIG